MPGHHGPSRPQHPRERCRAAAGPRRCRPGASHPADRARARRLGERRLPDRRLRAELDSDTVQIKRAEFDLGSGPFSQGAPTGSASVEWVAEENEEISVRLSGTLYAREADDSCVQIEVRYKDADGDIIETRPGDEHCLESDDLTTFPVFNGTNFSSYALRQVTYAILKDGVQVGAATVALGDPRIIVEDPSIPAP